MGGACVVARGGVHGFYLGGHAWLPGGHVWFYSGGHAWFYSGGVHGFIRGGMHGFIWGACVVLFWGHAWFYSAGGMRGFIQRGAWVVFFSFSGYNEIRSMSGRYASYWNAFLFTNTFAFHLLTRPLTGLCDDQREDETPRRDGVQWIQEDEAGAGDGFTRGGRHHRQSWGTTGQTLLPAQVHRSVTRMY